MWFLDNIVSALNSISSFFYSIYLEVYSWVYPFWLVAPLFYSLSSAFNNLAWQFYYFGQWVDSTTNRLLEILSWNTIQSYITDWLKWLPDPLTWFVNLWDRIQTKVNEWWDTTKTTVQGWIAVATEGLDTLKVNWSNFWNITFPQWTSKLDTLRGEWDNFWTVTLPTLIDVSWITPWWNDRLRDIQDLFNSWMLEFSPFWAGWQELRGTVTEFISNPLSWLEERFTDWFLGKE